MDWLYKPFEMTESMKWPWDGLSHHKVSGPTSTLRTVQFSFFAVTGTTAVTSGKKEISAKAWVTEARVVDGGTVLTIDVVKIRITNVVYFPIITIGVLFLFKDLFEKLINI